MRQQLAAVQRTTGLRHAGSGDINRVRAPVHDRNRHGVDPVAAGLGVSRFPQASCRAARGGPLHFIPDYRSAHRRRAGEVRPGGERCIAGARGSALAASDEYADVAGVPHADGVVGRPSADSPEWPRRVDGLEQSGGGGGVGDQRRHGRPRRYPLSGTLARRRIRAGPQPERQLRRSPARAASVPGCRRSALAGVLRPPACRGRAQAGARFGNDRRRAASGRRIEPAVTGARLDADCALVTSRPAVDRVGGAMRASKRRFCVSASLRRNPVFPNFSHFRTSMPY